MKKPKLREYQAGYKKYVEAFKREKKENSIKNSAKELTYDQYKIVKNKYKLSNKEIVAKQSKEYKTGYKKYVAAFEKEKKINNIQNGVKQLTYNQYKIARNEDKLNNKEILAKQTKLHTEAQKKRVMEDYEKYALKPGEKAVFDNTYWGGKSRQTLSDPFKSEGIGYHRTLSGLLADGHALHFLIAGRISHKEDKDTVLADYGY